MRDCYHLYEQGVRARICTITFPDAVEVTAVEVAWGERGRGHASTLMKQLVTDADAELATLLLFVLPDGSPGSLTFDELVSFYGRYGFVMCPEKGPSAMVRPPGRTTHPTGSTTERRRMAPMRGPAISTELPGPPPALTEPEVQVIPVPEVVAALGLMSDHLSAVPDGDEFDSRTLTFLAERLRDARQSGDVAVRLLVKEMASRGFTRAEVSEATGISTSTVQKWTAEAGITVRQGRPTGKAG